MDDEGWFYKNFKNALKGFMNNDRKPKFSSKTLDTQLTGFSTSYANESVNKGKSFRLCTALPITDASKPILCHLAFEELRYKCTQDADKHPERSRVIKVPEFIVPRKKKEKEVQKDPVIRETSRRPEVVVKRPESQMIPYEPPFMLTQPRRKVDEEPPVVLGPATMISSPFEVPPMPRRTYQPPILYEPKVEYKPIKQPERRESFLPQPFGLVEEEAVVEYEYEDLKSLGMIRPAHLKKVRIDYGCASAKAEANIDLILKSDAPLTGLNFKERIVAYDDFCIVWNTAFVAAEAQLQQLMALPTRFNLFSTSRRRVTAKMTMYEQKLDKLSALERTFVRYGFYPAPYNRELHMLNPLYVITALKIRNDMFVTQRMAAARRFSPVLVSLSGEDSSVVVANGCLLPRGLLTTCHVTSVVTFVHIPNGVTRLRREVELYHQFDLAIYTCCRRVMDTPTVRAPRDDDRVMVVYRDTVDPDDVPMTTTTSAIMNLGSIGFAYEVEVRPGMSGGIVVAIADNAVVGLHNGLYQGVPLFKAVPSVCYNDRQDQLPAYVQ